MSRSALIESLRRAAEDERAAVWREAHESAAASQAEADRSLATEKARLDADVVQASLQFAREGEARARVESRRARAAAATALADRLRKLMHDELVLARQGDRSRVFHALVAELPDLAWQVVSVNPADVDLATAAFPSARVERDLSIAGGLRAQTAGRGIEVSNTFDTRLERAWPDLLPQLMSAAFHDATDRPTAA